MHNAVLLLAEADSQREGALSLSLCFSAIEALLCDKTQGITEQLVRNVAALLEAQSSERLIVHKQLRKLYDIRSKATHGEFVGVVTQETFPPYCSSLDEVYMTRMVMARIGSSEEELVVEMDPLAKVRIEEDWGVEMDPLAKVRILATGVLAAVVEWRDYQLRLGDSSDRKDFLEQLADAEVSGRRMVGIPEEFGLFLRPLAFE